MRHKSKLKTYSLDEIKDSVIGKRGTYSRERYEKKLQMEIVRDYNKMLHKKINLTQEVLGKLVGVQKAQISKMQNYPKSEGFDTISNVFSALNAELVFDIKMKD